MDVVLDVLAKGGTVVTANNRLARGIELQFNRRQSAAGLRAWATPAIVPWRGWLEQLWWSSCNAGGTAGSYRLLSDTQARLLWREIVRDDSASSLPGFSGAAAGLAVRSWLACQDWRIPPDVLSGEADSADSRTFARWAGRYQDRCAQERWLDARLAIPHLIADLVSRRICVTGSVYLAGFDVVPPLHQELLRVMNSLGADVQTGAAPRATRDQAVRVECRDQQHELELAARWAREHRQQHPDAAIGVVVPNLATCLPEVRREFLDVLSPDWRLQPGQALPVNFSYGDSLARTGIARAALLTLRALTGQLDYRALGELLRTPYVPAWSEELADRARLELAMRQQIGARVDLQRLADRPGLKPEKFRTQLRAVLNCVANAPQRQGAAGWADTFGLALRCMGWPGDRPLASDEYQAAAAFQELIETLRGCEPITGGIGLVRALGLIETLAEEQLFQPASNPQVIQVLGVMEALGQEFDQLWICGMTSEGWPGPARPDPLLAIGLQRRLGLPDSSPAACRERAERQLRWLIAGARSVVVSWPRLRNDERQLPSPLIDTMAMAASEQLVRWQGQRLRDTLLSNPATEELALDPAPAVQGPVSFSGGIALLERQARCPARAFLEFRLGAREVATPSPGIDAGTRGSITHAVLEQFFRRYSEHSQLCRLPLVEQGLQLRELIDREITRRLPMRDPLVQCLARLEGRRLHELLTQFVETERKRNEFRVLWTEELPPSVSLPEAVRALNLTLRPDRVDELPDGAILVIDYKTGRKLPSAQETFGPRPRAPQLPLYATATGARGVAFVQLTNAGSKWLGVGEESWQIPGLVGTARWTRNAMMHWGELRAAWWSALGRLAQEFLDGSFTVDRWRHDEALGQWAMAIRIDDLPGPDDDVDP